MKAKKPLALDFVTALTVEECSAILLQESGRWTAHWQHVQLLPEGRFTLERLIIPPFRFTIDRGAGYKITFDGTLEPVPEGTHVWGAITRTWRGWDRGWRLRMAGIRVLGVVMALIAGWQLGLMAASLIVIFNLAVQGLMLRGRRDLHGYLFDLLDWITAQLYIPSEGGDVYDQAEHDILNLSYRKAKVR